MSGRRSCRIASVVFGLACATPAHAADVIVHSSGTALEDGIPGIDPDATTGCSANVCIGGTRDGQACSQHRDCPDIADGYLAFEQDKIHVVANYTVQGDYDFNTNSFLPFTLEITPGTIVKIASSCTKDSNGNIVSCEPTTFGGGQLYTADNSTLIVDGATVTDIRDDTEGGDTNNDGSASLPTPSYLLRFGGTSGELLKNSTIRYATIVGHFGSMDVVDNDFEKCGGAGYYHGPSFYKTSPPVRGAFPLISGNTFDFVGGTSGPGGLDVRGTSAFVWGNHLGGNGSGGITIGPMWETTSPYGFPLPANGVTIVAHNEIETKIGILMDPPPGNNDSILEQLRFRADIHDNALDGPGTPGTIGMRLSMFSSTTARSNLVENYAAPFQLGVSGVVNATSASAVSLIDLHVNANTFSLAGATAGPSQFYDTIWQSFHKFVDAERNWWGNASGPKDNSKIDGLVNPPGTALPVSNGIDYAPFLTKPATTTLDSLHLTASLSPEPPLPLEFTGAVISLNVDSLTLGSASTGKVTVHVRDSQGIVLASSPQKNVTSSTHSVSFDGIDLEEVPHFAGAIVVEAVLVPSGSTEEIRSNPVVFPIFVPGTRHFGLGCVDDGDIPGDCDPAALVPGNTAHLALHFAYNSASTVHYQVTLKELTRNHVLLHTFPAQNFTAPPSTFGQTVEFLTYTPELMTWNDPGRFLVIEYRAEDDGGNLINEEARWMEVNDVSANYLTTTIRALDLNLKETDGFPFGHLAMGEHPRIKFAIGYQVLTKNVTNWRIVIGNMEARKADDFVLHSYASHDVTSVATGKGTLTEFILTLDDDVVIPPNTRNFFVPVHLLGPEDEVLHESSALIDVRKIENSEGRTIGTGASTTSYPSVGVSLSASANSASGDLTIEEYFEAIQPKAPEPDFLRIEARTANVEAETRLIPLDRHYGIYDTLSDTGFVATITLPYDEDDFPTDPGFDEDNLVVVALNPLSGKLEALASTQNKNQHTVTAAYSGFYGEWTVASVSSAPAAGCADPTADGKTTAADALFALRASVGATQCATCVCDVNKNGSVTASDALLILKAAVGQTSAPTCVTCS